MKLSKRLSAAAKLVRSGSVAADIGCDHGKLCAYLLQSGRCAFVYAVDINPAPLEKARKLLDDMGLSQRSKTVLSDGAQALGDDVTDCIIAGVGADTAEHIISTAPLMRRKNINLVLVPSSKHERLRRFLYENGFQIYAESAVVEAGHCYTVMGARFVDAPEQKDELFYYTGRLLPDSQQSREYYKYIENKLKNKLSGLTLSNTDPEQCERLREMLLQLERMNND